MFLAADHFAGNVLDLATELIGREVVVRDAERDSELRGTVVETEAYAGRDDPASHAAFRPGGRAAAMFGPPGLIYIYAAYGMYPCLNIVTGVEGEPSAILIRGIVLPNGGAVSGPGRVSRHLGVRLDDHGRRLGDGRVEISAVRHSTSVLAGPRVGITRGVDLPWRFVGTLENEQGS